ncbi:uncharacterized protein LOC102712794 [Oryza brachyantha]|uniref:uncharacterized protein LOC102712794 n=1 Tax=Oryza brachyantha TaxID=4533 RepID=UPI001ADA4CF5|nr:uncharacterized protein LOC102712794 [Oryza brachyantha]
MIFIGRCLLDSPGNRREVDRSTMARRWRLRDRRSRRQRCGGGGDREDRLSALPNDLLLLVLRRVDTRTALATGLLSRRWAHLSRELPTLDFRVGDGLPARYDRCILRHRGVMRCGMLYGNSIRKDLMPAIRRHERRAMRGFVSSVKSFIDAADAADRPRRKLSRLSLEFFSTHHAGCINRLVSKAIDDWGVEELEAVAKPMYWQHPPAHAFPSHGLCKEPRASRLRSLTLGGCVLPPLHDYGAVTKLVLHGMPRSTPAAAYEGVFTSCPQLQVLHLKSCYLQWSLSLVVDAPMSEIRELVVDQCQIRVVRIRALPRLESLLSWGTQVLFDSAASSPCRLRQWHLAFRYGLKRKLHPCFIDDMELDDFFACTPDITNLIIRFTGPERWIVPSSSTSLLPGLTRLLVADVPSSWDVSWPRMLLEAAPSLQTLHIHIAPCDEDPSSEIPWQPTALRHHCLEEFAMAGFEGTERQVYFVKFVMGACTALRHVAIFKDGNVQYNGSWDWEMPRMLEISWTGKEKETMKKRLMDAASCSTDHLQIVLG